MTQDLRAAAAQARRAALAGAPDGVQARSQHPRDVGAARVVPCTAQLRAATVQRDGQEFIYLDGCASVTDKAYRMWDHFGEYDEVVERGAFAKTLAANPDVVYLINHKGLALARTAAGTLKVTMDEEGLRSEAWLNPKRQDVSDLRVAIDDGVITEMSFAFMLDQGEWSEDFSEFRITQLDIHRGDVSAVNYGANPYTTAARSRAILDDLAALPAGAAREALARLEQRTDLRTPPPAASAPVVPAAPAPTGASIEFYEQLLQLT